VNKSARFCVKCGANLEEQAASQIRSQAVPQLDKTEKVKTEPFVEDDEMKPARSGTNSQLNSQVRQAKQASKQYFGHFIQVLKSPVQVGQATNAGHMLHGVITFIMFSFILPLISYFLLRSALREYSFGFSSLESSVSFGEVVIKPFVFLLLLIFLVNSVIFFVLKLGKANITYGEVTARLGTFMIPAVAVLLLTLLLSLISAGSAITGLLIGIGVFSWFTAVCFTIYSLKKDHKSGLDPFYAVMITFVVSLLLFALFGDNIFLNMVGNKFWN